jgi:phosphatidylinositol glycan class A protein
MREKHQLHDRVELLGSIHHNDVVKVLNKGHIFLNCSLTEAFCIAILEAVSAGLYTVSTKVGGVPEVLPEDMMIFADPIAEDIVEALTAAIENIKNVKPFELHERAKKMYNWHDVAERTEYVYDKIIDHAEVSLFHRLRRYYDCGPFAGKLFCAFVAVDFMFWRYLEWAAPRSEIDIAIDFPTYRAYLEMSDSIWNQSHQFNISNS